jgi:2-C-methyl-D-erythritol 4-phosphate cytidylyltransferase
VAAVIPAGGEGSRLGVRAGEPPVPKALRLLAGRSLVQRGIDVLAAYVDEIVVAVPAPAAETLRVEAPDVRLRIVAGGATRQESVRNALAALSDQVTQVLVHDAARALMPADVVRRVLAALAAGATCVVPAIPVADSLRVVSADGSNAAADRAGVRLVQTPQGFALDALRRAHGAANTDRASDDASLVEAVGEPVTLVAGDPRGFKITYPFDLMLAESLLAQG